MSRGIPFNPASPEQPFVDIEQPWIEAPGQSIEVPDTQALCFRIVAKGPERRRRPIADNSLIR